MTKKSKNKKIRLLLVTFNLMLVKHTFSRAVSHLYKKTVMSNKAIIMQKSTRPHIAKVE